MAAHNPRIGMSACFFHPDPQRNVFKGRTLLYVEQSMAAYLMKEGVLPCMVPPPAGRFAVDDLVAQLDGLLLQGGSDVSPKSYGEEPLRPEWAGDYVRDQYEIALIEACVAQDKPVLGICRGPQIMNVAAGGTLFQDISTQNPDALVHRDWEIYDANAHEVEIEPGSGLAQLYPGVARGTINSVHHQGIKDLGAGYRVEARSPADGIIEAIRSEDPGRYLFGVQWHPEFQDGADDRLLDPRPILREFLDAVAART